MINARQARHGIIYRDPFAYCAHPHMTKTADGSWLVVFNRAPRRSLILHPPEEPLFQNLIIRSVDCGQHWCAPQVVPSYDAWGTECASLTVLANGCVLLNQCRFDWYPLDYARRLPDQTNLTYPREFMGSWLRSPEHETERYHPEDVNRLAPWVRGSPRSFMHISADNGASSTDSIVISTEPFSGGYGMRGAAELADGTLSCP